MTAYYLEAGALQSEVAIWILRRVVCVRGCGEGESDSPAPGGSGWLRVTPPLVGASSTPPGAPAVFRSVENPLFSFPSQHSKTKVYFKWPVPGRRLSTWIQVFPLSQPSLHLHVLTPPAASLVSCAIFFSSLGSSRLFACCVF